MIRLKATLLLTLCISANVYAQTQAPTPSTEGQGSAPSQTTESGRATSPAPPTPAPGADDDQFSMTGVRAAGIDVAGMFDGYYSFNNNHPSSGFNQLHNFEDHGNQFDLNLLKLTLSHDPGPIGFRVDVGGGRAIELMHTPIPEPGGFRFIEQAYVSFKPKSWKGFEADFGDFVTSAGAEVIETKDNWNYTRSLLFALAIPYYHFGIRTSMPIGSSVNVGVQVVNGWNSIVNTNGDNMQTVGITAAVTRKKFTWSNNYYVGPQYTDVTRGNRNLYDTTLLLTPNDKFNAYINFDYGQQHALISGLNHWIGVAAAAHWQVSKHFALSPRVEYYNDSTGFTTGTRQKLHEVTITGEYKMADGLLARAEYRHDGSNVPYFDHGLQPGVSQTQSTATIGLIAFFPVKH